MSELPAGLRIWAALLVCALVGLTWLTWAGQIPTANDTESIPESVRSNPGSYRPLYGTGWRAPSSGGGGGFFGGGK